RHLLVELLWEEEIKLMVSDAKTLTGRTTVGRGNRVDMTLTGRTTVGRGKKVDG
uniref:Uncharacterized protein n=1 Tax=Amphimedon queenslandica TaxID=400682 RepID=A0A1X7TKD6_AMPQE